MSSPIKLGDFVKITNGKIYVITSITCNDQDVEIRGNNLDGLGGEIIIHKTKSMFSGKLSESEKGFESFTGEITFIGKDDNPWIQKINIQRDTYSGLIKPLGETRIINSSKELLSIQPGETFKFTDFYFKFYDFADPTMLEHKNYLAGLSHAEICQWSIGEEFYLESLAQCRYMISITFIPENYNEESYAALIMSGPYLDKKSYYYYLLCARDFADQNNIDNSINPSFGVILQYIMGTFLDSIGKNKVFLNATENSYKYYLRWGYDLIGKVGDTYLESTSLPPTKLYDYSLAKLEQLQELTSRYSNYLVIS